MNSYPFPKAFRERLKRGLIVSSMGIDAMDGVVSLKDGKLNINFDPKNSPVFAQNYDTMMEMARLSGRKIYVSKRPWTVHPMGGACVGKLEQGGVVDAGGEVHGNPGLFVADFYRAASRDRGAADSDYRIMGRKRGQASHQEKLNARLPRCGSSAAATETID